MRYRYSGQSGQIGNVVMARAWAIQDAKNHFSELLSKALTEGPQTVTRHKTPVAMVVSIGDFEQRRRRHGSLVEFFQRSPLRSARLSLTREERWERDDD